MIAAANKQTYFCLLFASRISERAPQSGSNIHVVIIVFVEAEERTAQNVQSINTKYQCSLFVEIDNNRVDVYEDHRNV